MTAYLYPDYALATLQACDEYLDSLHEEALEQINASLDSDSNASSPSDNGSASN